MAVPKLFAAPLQHLGVEIPLMEGTWFGKGKG